MRARERDREREREREPAVGTYQAVVGTVADHDLAGAVVKAHAVVALEGGGLAGGLRLALAAEHNPGELAGDPVKLVNLRKPIPAVW